MNPPVKRPGRGSDKGRGVEGRTLIAGVLGAIVIVAGLLLWAAMTGGSRHVAPSKPGIGFTTDELVRSDAATSAAQADGAPGRDGRPDGG